MKCAFCESKNIKLVGTRLYCQECGVQYSISQTKAHEYYVKKEKEKLRQWNELYEHAG